MHVVVSRVWSTAYMANESRRHPGDLFLDPQSTDAPLGTLKSGMSLLELDEEKLSVRVQIVRYHISRLQNGNLDLRGRGRGSWSQRTRPGAHLGACPPPNGNCAMKHARIISDFVSGHGVMN